MASVFAENPIGYGIDSCQRNIRDLRIDGGSVGEQAKSISGPDEGKHDQQILAIVGGIR